MDAKLILFGNRIYTELELADDGQELVIGTSPSCPVRFDRTLFFEDFSLTIRREGDRRTLCCTPNLYIQGKNLLKQYMAPLNFEEPLHICYDSTGSELFTVECVMDFNRAACSWDVRITASQLPQISVGEDSGCDIQIQDPLLRGSSLVLYRSGDGYDMLIQGAGQNVEVNGARVRDSRIRLRDTDFFSLMGHHFYLSEGDLYTTSADDISTRLPVNRLDSPGSPLVYPRFVRSTRQKYVLPETCPEVLPPKSMETPPKRNLIMTLVPVLAGMVLMVMLRGFMGSGGMFIFYSVAMMGISAAMSVWTYFHDGRDYREREARRRERYLEYISKKEQEVAILREKESSIAHQKYLSTGEDVERIQRFDKRLFEKSPEDDDFLEIYLGEGTRVSCCPVKYRAPEYMDAEDDLDTLPGDLHDRYAKIASMPVTLSLKDASAVGFVGDRRALYNAVKNTVLDLCARHFYDDVRLYFILEEKDAELFSWIRWMKHAYDRESGLRGFLYDDASEKKILEFLYGELTRREQRNKERHGEQIGWERAVVFVYRSASLNVHPVSKYIERAASLGFTFLFFEEAEETLHSGCRDVIYLNSRNRSGIVVSSADGDRRQEYTWPYISTRTAAACARRLGGVCVDEVRLEASLTRNITLFDLLHIFSAQELDLRHSWASSKIYESMAAPLGVKSGGEVVCLDLHEKHHGPHGLVAGTTGSGKSEILQSYILSMAIRFHPYEAAFVIIDFKGGGMVNQFRSLPHLNGAITNIDGREIERSLLSIRAELRKRQEWFAKCGVNHIDAYIKKYKNGETAQPLPHLFLIVDEFAELKSDQPDFMKELISTARIGRSLGVHLILATQKPSGVVDDQIWSNSRFRLCLKVQNVQDSNEVLKSPLAAEIREPGRAYLQVGNNEIFQLFQSAYSGAPAQGNGIGQQKSFRISSVDLAGQREVLYQQKNRVKNEGETQLQAIVSYIAEYCRRNRIERLPDICLPPLADVIPFPSAAGPQEGTDICVPLGIYDDPERQLQEETFLNLTQENTFILGSSQFGKTNVLQVILKGIARSYTPYEVQVYILDFASMSLRNYETLAHVGGVITAADDEKLKTFFRMMAEEIQSRKEQLLASGVSSFSAYREAGYTELAQIVVLLDNLTAFKELYGQQYDDKWMTLCREGLAVGISVAATNAQTSGVGFRLLVNFAKRICLTCNEPSEYAYMLERCRVQPKNVPGRALTVLDKKICDVQVYLAYTAEKEVDRVKETAEYIREMNRIYEPMHARRIPVIPEVVTAEYIAAEYPRVNTRGYRMAIGLNFADIAPEVVDLESLGVLGLCGDAESGREDFLNCLLRRLLGRAEACPVELTIIDGMRRRWAALRNHPCTAEYTWDAGAGPEIIRRYDAELERRYRLLADGDEDALDRLPLLVLMLENREAAAVISKDTKCAEAYKRIVGKYRGLKVLVLLSDMENSAIGFGSPEVIKQMREHRNFLIFLNLNEQKLTDIPVAVAREFAKPLSPGECYRISGNAVRKLKTVREAENGGSRR